MQIIPRIFQYNFKTTVWKISIQKISNTARSLDHTLKLLKSSHQLHVMDQNMCMWRSWKHLAYTGDKPGTSLNTLSWRHFASHCISSNLFAISLWALRRVVISRSFFGSFNSSSVHEDLLSGSSISCKTFHQYL